MPAGIVEPGEDPITCAARELREETGYVAERLEPLIRFYPSPGFCTEEIHIFRAHGLHEEPGELDDDEELELVRMPLDEALALIDAGEITDSKTLIALCFNRKRFS